MPVTLVKSDPRRAKATTAPLHAPPKEGDFPSLDEAMMMLGFKPWPVSPIMQLPLEIREKIWGEVIKNEVGGEIRVRLFVNDPVARPRFLPACIKVSKQIKREMTPVFIRLVNFRMDSIGDNQFLRRFLDSTNAGRKHVRELQFDFFDCFRPGIPVNQDLKLACSCKGLKKLHVAFHWSRLKNQTVDYLVSRYLFEQLLDSKALTFFQIIPKGSLTVEEKATATELVTWVKKQFAMKGREIECKVLDS
ncbi:hypothetical protein DM02DRAFT_703430 [Periconia macrospinosa]|uniref:Uncharacterized protein n=1 Tax=Periconia macrospinosa TaxID=97972 RepID=A0A2V1EA74_9PLEO|nr:hypothetical protein DM02DRAFT_703430 [Periconia macrospinosa]